MWRAWRSERIVERGDGIVFGIGGLREIRLSYGLNGESERLGKLEQGSRIGIGGTVARPPLPQSR